MPILPNTNHEVPNEIFQLLKNFSCVQNNEGYSQAIIFHCINDDEELYLKIEKSDSDIKHEYEILKWLNGKLPVPVVKYFDEYNGYYFMLMTAIKSQRAGTYPNDDVRQPYENIIKLLADGLILFQSVDIIGSPFPISNKTEINHRKILHYIKNNTRDLNINLQNAYYSNENDINKFGFYGNNDISFESPMELYDWLNQNKPQVSHTELCFTHGDFGLTNTFLDDNGIAGFIDLGGGGIADKWLDIAICIRSIWYHSRNADEMKKYVELLFQRLSLKPDWNKINYYIWCSRLISRVNKATAV